MQIVLRMKSNPIGGKRIESGFNCMIPPPLTLTQPGVLWEGVWERLADPQSSHVTYVFSAMLSAFLIFSYLILYSLSHLHRMEESKYPNSNQ